MPVTLYEIMRSHSTENNNLRVKFISHSQSRDMYWGDVYVV
jgi:hypothetical protein